MHHKALYRAIGETDSRHRRPLSPARVVGRLILLDAVLADPDLIWLATDEDKAAHLSESTVRRERGLLQSIFERAIEEGHDFRNPFRGIKRGKDKPRTRGLSMEEESILLEALHPRFQRFVRFGLGTGCRVDEIRGIDPNRDIDWTRGTVHVTGKFRKERDVPMQPDARGALEEQLEEDGKLWTQNPQRLREVMAEGSARAKIPSLTPHALRHTFGTRWLQAGGDIYKLSKILGHSSVAVTEAHYAHLLRRSWWPRASR